MFTQHELYCTAQNEDSILSIKQHLARDTTYSGTTIASSHACMSAVSAASNTNSKSNVFTTKVCALSGHSDEVVFRTSIIELHITDAFGFFAYNKTNLKIKNII
jgi:hypothetical protein